MTANPKVIGFGEDLAFLGAPGLPFNGAPLNLVQSLVRRALGVQVGNGLYMGPLAAGSGGGWVVTDVAGTGALTIGSLGELVITTGTTDENATQIQQVQVPFVPSNSGAGTTKRLFFFCRVKVSTAATSDAMIGLAPVDTSLISASAEAFTEGLYFFKAATATDWTLTKRRSSSNDIAQAMGLTLTDGLYVILGFVVEHGNLRWFAKSDAGDGFAIPNDAGAYLGAGTIITAASLGGLPTGVSVFSALCGQEGGTTARSLTIDWAFCIQEK